ncbi:helix-turn-helix domain-containing protein [Vibrio paucivorans]|uniref:Helix-turn-helix domain-containing protein n=1 Tax=Vibrio paucivorans TaxID=2829489 RepID=A0A9X3CJD6_9VIBR|nr:helix-turn-helix transcriptional regulator [Vibrio paucivorans]MCW8336735.1 helix-turn-helix domain-containing protein [Vibrio paucivorans]
MNEIAEKFARNLINQRTKSALSQHKLSELCGFDKNYIGMLERAERRVTLEKVYILAARLECSLSDLLPEENSAHIEDMVKLK